MSRVSLMKRQQNIFVNQFEMINQQIDSVQTLIVLLLNIIIFLCFTNNVMALCLLGVVLHGELFL